MKTKLFLTLLVFCVTLTSSYASFPVERTAKTEILTTTNTTVDSNDSDVVFSSPAVSAAKDKWVGVALWFFLGWPFAAHRWYYGKPVGWNILFILTIGGLGVWAIIDLINILTDKFE